MNNGVCWWMTDNIPLSSEPTTPGRPSFHCWSGSLREEAEDLVWGWDQAQRVNFPKTLQQTFLFKKIIMFPSLNPKPVDPFFFHVICELFQNLVSLSLTGQECGNEKCHPVEFLFSGICLVLFFNKNNQCYAIVSNLETFYSLCIIAFLSQCVLLLEGGQAFFLFVKISSPVAKRENLKRQKISNLNCRYHLIDFFTVL